MNKPFCMTSPTTCVSSKSSPTCAYAKLPCEWVQPKSMFTCYPYMASQRDNVRYSSGASPTHHAPTAIVSLVGSRKLLWTIAARVCCGPTFKSSVRESTINNSQSLTKYDRNFNYLYVKHRVLQHICKHRPLRPALSLLQPISNKPNRVGTLGKGNQQIKTLTKQHKKEGMSYLSMPLVLLKMS